MAEEQMSEGEIATLERLLGELDVNGDGNISKDDIKALDER